MKKVVPIKKKCCWCQNKVQHYAQDGRELCPVGMERARPIIEMRMAAICNLPGLVSAATRLLREDVDHVSKTLIESADRK